MDVDEFVSSTRDDLAWGTVTPRRCRRHRWYYHGLDGEDIAGICMLCGKLKDEAVSRRGKLNRSRGNAIEREVAKQLGLRRVGHFGGAADAGDASEPFVASVKSGNGYFSERYWDQLKRLPVAGQQTAVLVVTDAPGPGHKRRAYVVVELTDWIALHGPEIEEAA
jgi:hypothetical protein